MPRTPTRTSTEQPVASARRRPRRNPASASGSTGSSYIDDLVLRDRDANTDWNDDASDGTLEERVYYCQNWRHDVVALVTSGGALRERVRYTAYGIPVGMPQGDCDGDGDVDAADQSILLGAWGTATAKCDLNLDGTVDATDNAILLGQLGATAGFGRLSLSGNRFGYAGYAADPAVHADWPVRHRVLMSALGRWSRRDPIGYVDGANLYSYATGRPTVSGDPSGLVGVAFAGGADLAVFLAGGVVPAAPPPPPGPGPGIGPHRPTVSDCHWLCACHEANCNRAAGCAHRKCTSSLDMLYRACAGGCYDACRNGTAGFWCASRCTACEATFDLARVIRVCDAQWLARLAKCETISLACYARCYLDVWPDRCEPDMPLPDCL